MYRKMIRLLSFHILKKSSDWYSTFYRTTSRLVKRRRRRMKRFFALVHKDEDSAFGVQFPDFEELFSAADEEENLIANATEALQLYCEDIDRVPIPSKFEDVIQRESVKTALSEGAFLIQVPFIENDAEVVRTNISIERGLLRAIDNCAQERGLTRSAFLATAARHELNI